MDLLIGTGNRGKLAEYQHLLAEVQMKLLSLQDVGLLDMEVDEDGATLEANARIKARAYARASGLVTLADDTGLMVDALGGAPGIHAARYGGPGLTMAERRQRLLDALAGVPDDRRTARFMCVIAVAVPGEAAVVTVEGACEGHIARQEMPGEHGFGYDPVFVPQGYSLPWSRISPDEKHRISHRGRAAQQIIPVLRRLAGA